MDRTLQETSVFESAERNGFRGALPGCTFLSGTFLSVTTWSIWLTWHSLVRNTSPYGSFTENTTGGRGEKTKQSLFLNLNQATGIKQPWTSPLVLHSLEHCTEQTPWDRNFSCLFFSVASLNPSSRPPAAQLSDVLCWGLQTRHLPAPHALVHGRKSPSNLPTTFPNSDPLPE